MNVSTGSGAVGSDTAQGSSYLTVTPTKKICERV